jgi:hypothetical protein
MMNTFVKKTFLYLSIALIAAILVLPLGGKIVFSLPDSNANPIQIDLSISENQIDIPDKAQDFKKDFKLKISIKNTSEKTVKLNLFNGLLPELKNSTNETIRRSGSSDILLLPQEKDFPDLPPGESLIIDKDVAVWSSTNPNTNYVYSSLYIQNPVETLFFNISEGTYYIYFVYTNFLDEISLLKKPITIRNIWKGIIYTDPVKLSIKV